MADQLGLAVAVGCTSTDAQAETVDTGWQLMVVFLLTLFTALVLLAAGFLLGVFALRDELARLTVLSEEIRQKSMTMQQLAQGHNANLNSCGELPPTGRHHRAG